MLRHRFIATITLMTIVAVGGIAYAKRIALPLPPKPGVQAMQAEMVILGKVIEIEKDTVDVTPFKGAGKDQKVSYKVAVIKIQESLLGAKGLTQLRVGFPADAQPLQRGNAPRIGRPAPIALTANMEGCFFLNPHHEGDFYVLPNLGGVVDKSDENFTKSMEEVKNVLKAIDDPKAALQAKEKNDRALAVQTLLTYYRNRPIPGGFKEEAIPADEAKLILQGLAEMPWQSGDPNQPSRGNLWYTIQPEKYGFKQPEIKPQRPGDPAIDYNKVWDEATAKFLKDNAEKIKISKLVPTK